MSMIFLTFSECPKRKYSLDQKLFLLFDEPLKKERFVIYGENKPCKVGYPASVLLYFSPPLTLGYVDK